MFRGVFIIFPVRIRLPSCFCIFIRHLSLVARQHQIYRAPCITKIKDFRTSLGYIPQCHFSEPWLYGDIRNLHLSFQQLHNHLFKNSIAQSYGFIFISARVFCTYKLNIANIYFFSCEKFSVLRTFRYFCSKNKRL